MDADKLDRLAAFWARSLMQALHSYRECNAGESPRVISIAPHVYLALKAVMPQGEPIHKVEGVALAVRELSDDDAPFELIPHDEHPPPANDVTNRALEEAIDLILTNARERVLHAVRAHIRS